MLYLLMNDDQFECFGLFLFSKATLENETAGSASERERPLIGRPLIMIDGLWTGEKNTLSSCLLCIVLQNVVLKISRYFREKFVGISC